ncbi:SYT6 protein, partial [Pomatostomus ruficeps]|nr:SYT6 protein [Pomatostomus ruficeps]
MSGPREDGRCRRAISILTELCQKKSLPSLDLDTCREFLLLPSDQSLIISEPGLGMSRAAGAAALTRRNLPVLWCWGCARSGGISGSPGIFHTIVQPWKLRGAISGFLLSLATEKIQPGLGPGQEPRVQLELCRGNALGSTEVFVSPCCRHISFKRHLPRQMHVSSMDYGLEPPAVAEQPTSIGRIKPELYKQKTVDTEDPKKEAEKTCGKINFTLKYDYENETLTVRILRAFDLPAKDFCGSSDPYVKIYLLPDRKRKFQTRVHRKTLNPTFDESFHFPVPHEELASRKLHLSVFDFDRFSRHDMIGEVILENLFEDSDLSRETSIWRDIQYATTVS